jgi:hypothetical protein
MDLEQWLVITLNLYACKTMWAWDLWLCACDHLLNFYFLRMLYVRLKILGECSFSLVFRKPGESELFPGVPVSPEIPGQARTFRTFEHQISFASLLSAWTVICISLLPVAHHKHPTTVILSCFSFCAKFGPNRTIDIQNQYAHIKGVLQIVFNFHWLSLVRLKCVVINQEKGGDWRVSWPPKWVLVI